MSSRLIAIVLVLAILLAGATMLVIQFGGSGSGPSSTGGAGGPLPSGARLVEASAGEIRQVVISRPGAADTLARGEDGGWWLVGAGEQRWPIDDGRMDAALRMITEARSVAEVAPQTAIDHDGSTVTLTLVDGRTITVQLAAQTLGGQGLAEVQMGGSPGGKPGPKRLAVITDALHRTMTVGSAKHWRRTELLPRVAQTAVGLRIVGRAGSIALKKVEGRWGVMEPVSGPADAEAVARALAVIEGLSVTKYFDEAGDPPASVRASLESPQGRLLIDVLEPAAKPGQPGTRLIEVTLGGVADPQGKTIAVAVGGVTAAVDAGKLAQLTLDPTRYLSPTATVVRPQDVGGLALSVTPDTPGAKPVERSWRRTLDGWLEMRPGGGEVLQTKDRGAQIEATLSLLAGVPASSIKLEQPPGYQAIGSVKLTSPGGAPLDNLELGRAPGSALWVRQTGSEIYRSYAQLPGSVAALAPELLGAPPAPVEIKPTDVNK